MFLLSYLCWPSCSFCFHSISLSHIRRHDPDCPKLEFDERDIHLLDCMFPQEDIERPIFLRHELWVEIYKLDSNIPYSWDQIQTRRVPLMLRVRSPSILAVHRPAFLLWYLLTYNFKYKLKIAWERKCLNKMSFLFQKKIWSKYGSSLIIEPK